MQQKSKRRSDYEEGRSEAWTAIPNIPSLLRWFQEDDPGQDALDHHPHQACHHLPGAQTLLLSRFYQYKCKEWRQGRLRIQGNTQQIRL